MAREAAKILERRTKAEPDRADYQRDLVVSLIRVGRREDLDRALTILDPLRERGALTAQQQEWPELIRQMLDDLGKGAGA